MKKLKFILTFAMLLGGVAAVGAVAANNDVNKVEAAETKTYSLVTAAPSDWSGEYLIVYKESATIGKALDASKGSSIDAVSNFQQLTIEGEKITASSAYSFIVAKSGNGYTISTNTATKYYIGNVSSSTNGLKNSTSSTTYTNTITLNSNGNVSIAVEGGSTTLAFNTTSGQTRFRYYKNTTITGQYADSYPLPYLYAAPTVVESGVTVSFDANGGTFVDSSKWESKKDANGPIEGKLPDFTDMASTPYKYTQLVGWIGGSESYDPGDDYSVTVSTTFSAVYEAPELITISQALEICEIAGSTQTPYAFTTEGEVVSIGAMNTSYHQVDVVITDGTNELLAYGLSVPSELDTPEFVIGDTIRVTGYLKTFNNTAEFNYGCTYTVVEKAGPTLTEQLAEVQTRASVGFSYTKAGEEYTFSNVRLSFKATVDAELYEQLNVTGAGFEATIAEEGSATKVIDCSNKIGTDANGDNYIFGSILVPAEHKAVVVTAKAYFVVDGTKVYLQETAHSLETAVQAYLSDAVELTTEQLAAVTALAAAYGISAE